MIGDKIKALREQFGLTQEELADRIPITRSTLANYEINLREPKGAILVNIAKALNTTTDFLLGNQSETEPKQSEPIANPQNSLKGYLTTVLKERGYTVGKLARLAGIEPSYLAGILNGRISRPSYEEAMKLADVLGVSRPTMIKLAGLLVKNSDDLSEKDKEGASRLWLRADGLTEDDVAEVLALIAAKERRRKKGETNR